MLALLALHQPLSARLDMFRNPANAIDVAAKNLTNCLLLHSFDFVFFAILLSQNDVTASPISAFSSISY
jgi:hypothetical protein